MAKKNTKDLEVILCELEKCKDRKYLSKIWSEHFRRQVPNNLSTRILKAATIYGIQMMLLSKQCNITDKTFEKVDVKDISFVKALPAQTKLKSGTVLSKIWKGKEIKVQILNEKFIFENNVYSSLSEIARDITGTRWSGPRFFGLNG